MVVSYCFSKKRINEIYRLTCKRDSIADSMNDHTLFDVDCVDDPGEKKREKE